MAKKKEQQRRRCAMCRKTGHNKKTCPNFVLEKKVKKDTLPPKRHTKKAKTKVIRVTVKKDQKTSPHVVNLRKKEDTQTLNDVALYKKKVSSIPARVDVDFARYIKEANNKKKECIPIIEEPKKIKRERVSSVRSKIEDLKEKGKDIINTIKGLPQAFAFKKFIAASAVLVTLVAIPIPAVGYYKDLQHDGDRVVEASTSAFFSLQASLTAMFSANIGQAQYNLLDALESFETANSVLEKDRNVALFIAKLLPVVGTKVSSRQHILTAGHHIALGNTILVKGLTDAQKEDLSFQERMTIIQNHTKTAIPQFESTLEELKHVDTLTLPIEFQEVFEAFKDTLFPAFLNDMHDVVEIGTVIDTLGSGVKNYIVLFQNEDELRPTGGFLGSYAIVEVYEGKIKNITVPPGGLYDLQGYFGEHIKSPAPLQLINSRFEIQDFNWTPHTPAFAKRMMEVQEKIGGKTIDGVILLNSSLLERIVEKVIAKPIAHEKLGELSADTILSAIQDEVEEGFEEEGKPKVVIGEILDTVIEEVTTLDVQGMMRFVTEMYGATQEREIQIVMRDAAAQQIIESFGIDGGLRETSENQDYLMVVDANIGGLKSNACVLQHIDHQSVVKESGQIENTVTVTRKNTCKKEDKHQYANNISYLRVYTPQGSTLDHVGGTILHPAEDDFQLIGNHLKNDEVLTTWEKEIGFDQASGTRITSEFGKTVFGNWAITPPGEISEISFTYVLPFSVSTGGNETTNSKKWQSVFQKDARNIGKYSVLVQKQSGSHSQFSSQIIFPKTWNSVWKSDSEMILAQNGATFETELTKDTVLGLIMEKVN
ncbi:MAG: DUF4012 domain-containing protein [Candidatus Magasanikbacteria bacterium]|nr:DUF4012 domain-containing protein [Candidatus Magasanikbacteria bacterium]